MVLFNYSTKELTAKVVYYGPGLCGKTTNLQFIHGNLGDEVRGKMLSLATKTDRTLFFDFLPIDLGDIRGMKTRVQLYTVPGQVFYNETRRLVLKGADGIVFVADSQKEMLNANIESFKNLEENLKAHGMNLAEMPHVIQYNKRDLPKLGTIEEFNAAINKYNAPFYESVATTGIGVQDTLKAIVKLVLLNLTKKYDPESKGAQDAKLPEPKPVTPDPAPPAPPVEAPPVTVETETPVLPEPMPAAKPGPPPPPDFHAPQAALEPEAPAFDDNEIDDLVGEVQESPPMAAKPPEPPDFGIPLSDPAAGPVHAGGGLQTATGATPEVPPPPAIEPKAEGPFVVDRDFDPEWGAGGAPTEVEVTEVTPGTLAQRIEAGAGPQEIVVPLEVADGDRVFRYRLTLKVQVDEQLG